MQLTSQTLDITVQSKLVKFLIVTDNIQIHCSAVITRSSGAMNTDRVIRGPRYTWSA